MVREISMNHGVLPQSLRTGDILAFRRSKGFWGRLIRFWTSSRVVHVGIVLVLDLGDKYQWFVVEAKEGRGVRIVPIVPYVSTSWDRVDVFRCCAGNLGGFESESKAREWLTSHETISYAPWWQFILSFSFVFSQARALLRKYGIVVKADASPSSMHCSEFVSTFLQAVGVDIPKEPVCMSPQDVVDLPICKVGRLL